MITWGNKGNNNTQQLQSLGAIATGNKHQFTRFRLAADGASLHPLQRNGVVASDSHNFGVKQVAGGPRGLGDTHLAVPYTTMQMPPIMNLYSGQINPIARV